MSLLHLGSSVVLLSHSHEKSLGSVSFLWMAIFYAGGFILMFVVGILIVIRRGERTHYQLVDKTALAIAVSAIVVFAILRRSI